MSLHWCSVETRLGRFHVASHNGKIVHVRLPGSDIEPLWSDLAKWYPGQEPSSAIEPVLQRAAVQLQEFADGIRAEFDLPIELHGTDFQQSVWNQLMQIPYGETRSYADIAAALGKPAASRAVGGANRVNPLAPIVPCHRVIAADGGLGGYMGQWGEGGGLGLKQRLLEMEKARFAEA